MDELQGRAADLLTRQAQPHLTARGALESLVAADAVSYADQCRRCGGSDTVVEARAARFEGDLQTPH
jgi:hypothetical protein